MAVYVVPTAFKSMVSPLSLSAGSDCLAALAVAAAVDVGDITFGNGSPAASFTNACTIRSSNALLSALLSSPLLSSAAPTIDMLPVTANTQANANHRFTSLCMPLLSAELQCAR